jgi:cytochrome c
MLKWIITTAIVLAAPVAAQAQDVEAGKGVFKKCQACHQIGKNALGPNLQCVIGRKAGSVADFAGYSEAMKNAGFNWEDEKFLAYIENPKGLVAGNKMIFAGIKDATERQNLLAYLKTECPK